MTKQTIYVRGAYGRRYSSVAQAQPHWDDDKDFEIVKIDSPRLARIGRYINKQDAERFLEVGDTIRLCLPEPYFSTKSKLFYTKEDA